VFLAITTSSHPRDALEKNSFSLQIVHFMLCLIQLNEEFDRTIFFCDGLTHYSFLATLLFVFSLSGDTFLLPRENPKESRTSKFPH